MKYSFSARNSVNFKMSYKLVTYRFTNFWDPEILKLYKNVYSKLQ